MWIIAKRLHGVQTVLVAQKMCKSVCRGCVNDHLTPIDHNTFTIVDFVEGNHIFACHFAWNANIRTFVHKGNIN